VNDGDNLFIGYPLQLIGCVKTAIRYSGSAIRQIYDAFYFWL